MTSSSTEVPETRGSQTARRSSVVVGESNDIYTDPSIANSAVASAVRDDPLFRFLAQSWRSVVVVVLAIAAAWYGWRGFQSTREESVRHAADIFSRLRIEFEELNRLNAERATVLKEVAELEQNIASPAAAPKRGENAKAGVVANAEEQQKEIDQKRARLEEIAATVTKTRERAQQTSLLLTDAREPYRSLAALYQVLIQADGSSAVPPPAESAAATELALVQELQTLAAARRELEVNRAEGIERLVGLAESAHYTRAYAALILAQIADSEQERVRAREIIEGVQRNFPDQSALLDGELRRLRSGLTTR